MALLLVLATDQAHGFDWTVMPVDTEGWSGQHSSVGVDRFGRVGIAYSYADPETLQGQVRYAAWTGAAWSIEVAATDGGSYASLAFDAEGNPWIAYRSGERVLKVATRLGDTWTTQEVYTSPVDYGVQDPSMVFIGENRPAIAFYADMNYYNGGSLKLAASDGGQWGVEEVEYVGRRFGSTVSAAVDRSGRPAICYTASGDRVQYASHDGTSWHTETIDQRYQGGDGPVSLSLDANDIPHISYRDGVSGSPTMGLKYAVQDTDGWQLSQVRHGQYTGLCNGIALDAAGTPYIAFSDEWATGELWVAAWEDTGWQFELVPDVSMALNSMAMDRYGHMHLSLYFGGTVDQRDVYYALGVPEPATAALVAAGLAALVARRRKATR